MRVVLDTNTLIVSIGKSSDFRPIFDALINGRIKLVISNDTISEYHEVLTEQTTAIIADNITDFLVNSKNVVKTEIYFKWSLITADGDDNKFVDCALNGKARFLVTDDKHFNVLKSNKFPEVTVVKTEAFLNIILKGKI